VYYYHPRNGRKGVPPSVTTTKTNGTVVKNEQVVEEIRKVLSGEFVCYGYQNVSMDLKDMDYSQQLRARSGQKVRVLRLRSPSPIIWTTTTTADGIALLNG
jgi:hypothetical protein